MNRRVSASGAGLFAAVAVAISACSSPSNPSHAAEPATQSSPPPAVGAAGTVAAVTATDIEVQNPPAPARCESRSPPRPASPRR